MDPESHDPLLSNEETEALLEAMRSGVNVGPDVATAELGSVDRVLHLALTRADRCADELSRAIRRVMLRIARCSSTCEVMPSEILTWNVLEKSIPQGGAVAILRSRDLSQGLMIMGPALTSFVMERRLGAPLPSATTEPGAEPIVRPVRNELTAFDRRVLGPFADAATQGFCGVWSERRDDLYVSEILPRPSELPPMSQLEAYLRVGIKISSVAGVADDLIVALTAGAVRATTPRPKIEMPAVMPSDRARMAERIAAADIEVVAFLGKVASTVRDVLSLAVGDVVRLDSVPEKSLDVNVAGLPKMRGMPVVHHGNLAIEVTETL